MHIQLLLNKAHESHVPSVVVPAPEGVYRNGR